MRILEVTQTHNLGRVVALTRLGSLKPEPNSGIKVVDINFDDGAILFKAVAYTHTIHGSLTVTDDYVKLVTDPLPWIFLPAIWYAKSQIQTMFAKALA